MGILVGNIVSLRPILKKDLGLLNTWKNDEDVYQYLGGGYQPVSIDQQEKWIDSIIDLTGNNRRFIIENEVSKAIGMIGLYDIHWIHKTCEIGIYIGDKNWRRKRYASDACAVIERYAYKYLNLRKINLKVVSDNVAGKRLWARMGYEVVGTMTRERYINGEYCDVLLMEKFIGESSCEDIVDIPKSQS